MVKNLYEAFLALYADLLKEIPELPADHALAQEAEIYEKSNRLTYRSVNSSAAHLKHCQRLMFAIQGCDIIYCLTEKAAETYRHLS